MHCHDARSSPELADVPAARRPGHGRVLVVRTRARPDRVGPAGALGTGRRRPFVGEEFAERARGGIDEAAGD